MQDCKYVVGNTPVSSVEMPFEGQFCLNMHADGETQMQSCLLKIQRDSKILQQTQYSFFQNVVNLAQAI